MADHVFYEKGRNRGNTRTIVIKGAKLLPGRKPGSSKRITIPVLMPLSNQKTGGTPEWVETAHTFVAKTGDPVNPVLTLKGYDIDFATENRNLFNDEKVPVPSCNLKAFSIHTQGSEEEPEIVMEFTINAPFSTRLWQYLGQIPNDPVWAKFTPATIAAGDDNQEDLELEDEEGEDEDTEDEGETEEEGIDDDTESEE